MDQLKWSEFYRDNEKRLPNLVQLVELMDRQEHNDDKVGEDTPGQEYCIEALSPFCRVFRRGGWTPILAELAVIDHQIGRSKGERKFTSAMVSYLGGSAEASDSGDQLLRSWVQSIEALEEDSVSGEEDGLIVLNEQAYENVYFVADASDDGMFQSLNSQVGAVDESDAKKSAKKLRLRSAAKQDQIETTGEKPESFNDSPPTKLDRFNIGNVVFSARPEVSVERLLRRTIRSLEEELRSAHDSKDRGLAENLATILNGLRSAKLVVMPFGRPEIDLEDLADDQSSKDMFVEFSDVVEPGGCLFALVIPNDDDENGSGQYATGLDGLRQAVFKCQLLLGQCSQIEARILLNNEIEESKRLAGERDKLREMAKAVDVSHALKTLAGICSEGVKNLEVQLRGMVEAEYEGDTSLDSVKSSTDGRDLPVGSGIARDDVVLLHKGVLKILPRISQLAGVTDYVVRAYKQSMKEKDEVTTVDEELSDRLTLPKFLQFVEGCHLLNVETTRAMHGYTKYLDVGFETLDLCADDMPAYFVRYDQNYLHLVMQELVSNCLRHGARPSTGAGNYEVGSMKLYRGQDIVDGAPILLLESRNGVPSAFVNKARKVCNTRDNAQFTSGLRSLVFATKAHRFEPPELRFDEQNLEFSLTIPLALLAT